MQSRSSPCKVDEGAATCCEREKDNVLRHCCLDVLETRLLARRAVGVGKGRRISQSRVSRSLGEISMLERRQKPQRDAEA